MKFIKFTLINECDIYIDPIKVSAVTELMDGNTRIDIGIDSYVVVRDKPYDVVKRLQAEP